MSICRIVKQFLLVISVLFLTSACLDVKVSSKVNSDGSVLRTVVVEGDSSAIFESYFPIPRDTTWDITLEIVLNDDGDATENLRLTASKFYDDIKQLNADFAISDPDQIGLNIEFYLTKKFRWFYTVYEYQESYRSNNPFDAIPLPSGVTREDVEGSFSGMYNDDGDSSDSLKTGNDLDFDLDEWFFENVFESYYNEFLASVKTYGGDKIQAETVSKNKDALKAIALSKQHDSDSLDELYRSILGESPVNWVLEQNPEPFALILEQIEFSTELISQTDYSLQVTMPGIIVDSNSSSVTGNTVKWEEFTPYLEFFDETLFVISRKLNWWIIGLSGAIVILLAAGFIMSAIRLRR